jgi:hypothetical protein
VTQKNPYRFCSGVSACSDYRNSYHIEPLIKKAAKIFSQRLL